MLEATKDIAGGTHYASRNHNDIEQLWKTQKGIERFQVDWTLTLRQTVPKLIKSKYSASVPSFHTVRNRCKTGEDTHTTPPEEGPYLSGSDTNGKYQNYAETNHFLKNNMQGRVSSGGVPEINWQLNLRNSLSGYPDKKWKRYCQRPHQSFDMAKENFNNDNYKNQNNSPILKQYERNQSSLPMATLRDTPLKLDIWPGCEGTALNTWEALVSDKKHGHKSRDSIKWETTLREKEGYLKNLGSRLQNNRSEGCISEFLGKKKGPGYGAFPVENELAKPYREGGDPKLNVIQPMHLGEKDDRVLQLRRNKQERRKVNGVNGGVGEEGEGG